MLSSSIAGLKQQGGKKESTGRRRDRHCPPCARPSSNSSLDQRHSDARAAENGFAAKSSVNKSAKVVLGRIALHGGEAIHRRHALMIAPTNGRDRSLTPFKLLLLAMLGHTGPICVTPLVGQGAALLQGRPASCTDWIAGGLGSSRAGEGDRSHPEGCDCRCQSERRRGVGGKLRFRGQHWRISCDDVSMLLTAQESRSHRFLFIEVTNTC